MNLDCIELITDYLQQSNIGEVEMTTDMSKKSTSINRYGYERGWAIEKILGATDIYGELMFL